MGRPIQVIEIAEDDDGLKIFVYDGEGYTDKQRRLMDAIVKQFPKGARAEFVGKAALVHEMEDK